MKLHKIIWFWIFALLFFATGCSKKDDMQMRVFPSFEAATEAASALIDNPSEWSDCSLEDLPAHLQDLPLSMTDGSRTVNWSACVWMAAGQNGAAVFDAVSSEELQIVVVIIGIDLPQEVQAAQARKEVTGNMTSFLYSGYDEVSSSTTNTVWDADAALVSSKEDQLILGVKYHIIVPELFPDGPIQWVPQEEETMIHFCQRLCAHRIMLHNDTIGYFESEADRALTEGEMDEVIFKYCMEQYVIMSEAIPVTPLTELLGP